MRNWFATVMALLGGGSWNGNVMGAFSANPRRILSLWLPRLPIDRIKRQLVNGIVAPVDGRLSPPLRGRGGEGGITNTGVCGSPPSLTLPRKGGGNGERESVGCDRT